MAGLRTEFAFVLPKGLVDGEGRVHREGVMRLATARDELEPLNDPKVKDADDPYLTVIVLSRVIISLGELTRLNPRDIEGLFAADLAYLQDVYAAVNFGSGADIDRVLASGAASAGLAPASAAEQPRAAPPTLGALRQPTPAPLAMVTPRAPAASDHEPAEDDDAPDAVGHGSRLDDEGIELPSRSRRARIEEVGRSSGLPTDPR